MYQKPEGAKLTRLTESLGKFWALVNLYFTTVNFFDTSCMLSKWFCFIRSKKSQQRKTVYHKMDMETRICESLFIFLNSEICNCLWFLFFFVNSFHQMFFNIFLHILKYVWHFWCENQNKVSVT